MEIKATHSIIDWDADAGRMVVINAGETGTLSETMRSKHEGSWEPVNKRDIPQFDHDSNGEPGGSTVHEPPVLKGKNKAQLLAVAEDEGVEIAEGLTNAQIVEAIELKRKAAPLIGEDGQPVDLPAGDLEQDLANPAGISADGNGEPGEGAGDATDDTDDADEAPSS